MPAKASPLVANMSNLFDSGAFMAANCSGQVYTVAVAAVRDVHPLVSPPSPPPPSLRILWCIPPSHIYHPV